MSIEIYTDLPYLPVIFARSKKYPLYAEYFFTGRVDMNKVIFKICIIIILSCILAFLLLNTKTDGDNLEKDKVTLTEKYYAPSQSSIAVGIKTKKEIAVKNTEKKKCALEFSNKKIFEVDCDKYLDYKLGDKVVIRYRDDKLVKLGKK
ncbi:hypothetical protein ACOJQI_09255 [Bacillus salacetis]|uniref:hypothetical protein n=1 Tax=Bacillus salacetis TaxID=2315464 RepID=UPI003BA3358B